MKKRICHQAPCYVPPYHHQKKKVVCPTRRPLRIYFFRKNVTRPRNADFAQFGTARTLFLVGAELGEVCLPLGGHVPLTLFEGNGNGHYNDKTG